MVEPRRAACAASGNEPGRLCAVYAGKAAYVAAARRILNCPALAEDVVQDVMLRLAADPPAGVATQGPYVARMVRNLAIDRARRRHFESRTFAQLDDAVAGRSCDGSDPERETAANQSLRLAEAAVASLPEPIRTVFRLHRIEGVPQNEIAARMGVSRALVCGLVKRGHRRCLAALDGTCREPGCPLEVGAAADEDWDEDRAEPGKEGVRCQAASRSALAVGALARPPAHRPASATR